MNEARNKERLLDEVLAEPSDLGLREALLSQTIQLVRRQRRVRQFRRYSAIVTVIAGLLLLVWRFAQVSPTHERPAAKPYTLVRTQPLPEQSIAHTQPQPVSGVVSSAHDVAVVVITSGPGVQELTDDELLELAGPASVGLVRHGANSAELVFADPADKATLLRN